MIEKLFKVSESSDLSTFSSESKKGESDVQKCSKLFPILMLIPKYHADTKCQSYSTVK